MRWMKEPAPVEGNLRVIEFFAWLPVTMGLETRWLEWVIVQQQYSEVKVFNSDIYDMWERSYFKWIDLRFIEREIDIFHP